MRQISAERRFDSYQDYQNMDRWASGLCQQTVNLPPTGIVGSNPTLSTKFDVTAGGAIFMRSHSRSIREVTTNYASLAQR